jgi:putative transcriptional regulator
MLRGDWFVIPADMDFLFDEDPYEVWDRLVQKVYEAHRLLPHTSENPEWN